jgi:DNA (cytosine-5)-methyltransferase 1
MVLIENVPEVVNDRSDVVTSARHYLRQMGYNFLDSGILAAHEMGWAQTRKRFFLVAARQEFSDDRITLKAVASGLKREALGLGWRSET